MGNEGKQARHLSVTKLLSAEVNIPQKWEKFFCIFVVPQDVRGRREKVPVSTGTGYQKKTLPVARLESAGAAHILSVPIPALMPFSSTA